MEGVKARGVRGWVGGGGVETKTVSFMNKSATTRLFIPRGPGKVRCWPPALHVIQQYLATYVFFFFI